MEKDIILTATELIQKEMEKYRRKGDEEIRYGMKVAADLIYQELYLDKIKGGNEE